MNLKELNKKIIDWAKEREIDKKGTIEGQAIKTIEEMSELIKGICKDDIDLIKDSIGDVYVTLVIGCMLSGADISRPIEYFSKKENLKKEADSINDKIKAINQISYFTEYITEDLGQINHTYFGTHLFSAVAIILMTSSYYNTTLEECVQLAYKEISGRKGKMIDGVFVKEEDLKGRLD